MNERLFFHFQGEKVHPSGIRAGELGALLEAIEEALSITVIDQHPTLTKENLLIGLSAVEAGSIDLQFTTVLPELVVPAYEEVARAFRENDPSALPIASYPAFEKILRFAQKNDAQIDLDILNGTPRHTLVTIPPNFTLPKATYITGETTLYGELVRVGGSEPKAEVKPISGKTLFCPFPKELASQLGQLLYTEISVTGQATWSADTYEIVEFKITALNEYRPALLTEAFAELRQVVGRYYDDIEDVTAYVSELRKG